jgi:hypothetical protein
MRPAPTRTTFSTSPGRRERILRAVVRRLSGPSARRTTVKTILLGAGMPDALVGKPLVDLDAGA